jgi:DNA-binding transcriptional MerR regulator
LQQVRSLRQLGFSLEEIRDCLDSPGFEPRELIRLQIGRLREQIALQTELCARLEAIAAQLDAAEDVSAETILQTIERMTMIESYYTPEQLELLKKRREEVGEERMRQVPADWAELIAQVRAQKERGTDPSDPVVQDLARRWMSLIEEFTGGDPGVANSLGRVWKEQGDNLVAQHGAQYDSRDVFEYIGRAMAVVKGQE